MTLMQARDASVFHHPAWLVNLRDTYSYDIWASCLADPGGRLLAGLPVATIRSRITGDRLVSVPFSDVCEPVTDGDDSLLEPLARALESERRRLGLGLEVHGSFPGLVPASRGDSFLHHVLDLRSGWDAVWNSMHRSKRKAVRKAPRLEVSLARRTDPGALDIFYAMHVKTRHKHGAPTQPKRFIKRLSRMFVDGLGFVLVATHEGEPIAANVFLSFNGVMTAKYNASDERKLDLRANQLMHVEAFRLACEANCHSFDFGRTELDNQGLQTFKEGLGAAGRPLSYTMVPGGPTSSSVRTVSKLQRATIRRAPPLFGRVLGAAVYRHFG